MKNDSVKKVVATGIGAALFFVLARFVAIPSGIPNTNIALQYGIQTVFAVLYGPIVGGLSGFIGHVLTDMSWGGVWWSWAFGTLVYGVIVGLGANKINIKSGNFGKKDLNRYRETKYISNRGERTVDDKNIVIQVLGTLSKKTYADYPFIEKHRALLPIGWIAEGGKYVGYLISGERKSEGTTAMLKEAAKRKDIYHKMELFKTE